MYARGLVCDSVRGFEVVLANGSIVEANVGENADLWRALKGGGAGNFGVVTRVDVEVFPRLPVWVAARRFPAGREGVGERHVEALVEWVDDGVRGYRNASALVFWTYKPGDNGTVVNTRLTDVGGRAAAPVFEKFLAIGGNISSLVGMTNLSTLSPNTVSYGYR